MPKYSVKKPFTILVAVILVLVLGLCQPDRHPDGPAARMNLPY